MKKILFAILLFASGSVFATQYYAGAAKTNITPKRHHRAEVCMGGYGAPYQKCGLTQIHDRLSSRTLAISDRHTTMIITSLDVPGISKAIIDQIKNRVHRRFGIDPDHVFIAATHSHSAPDILGVWGGSSERYQRYVIRKVVRSIRRALRKREPARIYAASTFAPVENRRGHNVVDDSVNILDVVSRYRHRRIGTLINMSAHPTIVPPQNTRYSAGYVHTLRRTVERSLGGVSIFVNGVVGDAQASTNDMFGLDVARDYGQLVAENVIEEIPYRQRVRGNLSIRTATFTHPVTNPLVLGGIQAGLIDLQLTSDNQVTSQVSLFAFGDTVEGITFPGEALTRLVNPVQQQLGADYTFFFGLTNDSLGYFLPSDEYLQIPGRTTEESASLDPLIGDKAKAVLIDLITQ